MWSSMAMNASIVNDAKEGMDMIQTYWHGKGHPGSKIWRKGFKAMIKLQQTMINNKSLSVENLKDSFIGPGLADDHVAIATALANEPILVEIELDRKRDMIELRIMQYAYQVDTRNTILEMKKFKKLCQEESADLLNRNTGDAAFKDNMEAMGEQITYYEGMCKVLVNWNIYNKLK